MIPRSISSRDESLGIEPAQQNMPHLSRGISVT